MMGLKAIHVANAQALEFAEKVKRYELQTLPAVTHLSLPSIGDRGAGDSVELKFRIGRGERSIVDERRRLNLQWLLSHVQSTAGLILAMPLPVTPVAGNNALFQAAPSYSVLYKFGTRGARFWSDVFQFGMGLNVAAPDFNHDSIPELGAGLSLSMFRDILQVGIGYNFFANQAYPFVGLGLPLPSLTGATGIVSSDAGASRPR
jgi:hypothetical protein